MTAARLGRLALRTLVQAALVAIVVGLLSFAMMEALPGDAAYRIAASRYGYDMMDAAAAEAVRAELGLDRPAIVRLGQWLAQLATFDLGRSLVSGQPVIHEVAHQAGASAILAACALLVALAIAIPLGTAAGLNPGGGLDRFTLIFSVLLRAVPSYALAVVLILVFAVQLRWLPVAGYGGLRHFVLPTLTLGLGLAALSSRVVRDAVRGVDSSGYMRFARLKGLTDAQAIRRHGPRNVAGPLAALIGVQVALLIEGVVVVESIFAWPGIGHAMVHALFARDVPMVQGTTLILGLGFVVVRGVTEAIALAADPRLEAA